MSAEPGKKDSVFKRPAMAHCLPENSDEPATRENRAKLKRSSKYSTPYIPINAPSQVV